MNNIIPIIKSKDGGRTICSYHRLTQIQAFSFFVSARYTQKTQLLESTTSSSPQQKVSFVTYNNTTTTRVKKKKLDLLTQHLFLNYYKYNIKYDFKVKDREKIKGTLNISLRMMRLFKYFNVCHASNFSFS